MIQTELFVKMAIDRWNGSIVNLNKYLDNLTDEQKSLLSNYILSYREANTVVSK